jgi:phage terminase small subunit
MKQDSEKALTDKQELFCREYLVDLNGTQAAIRAGYSEKTAAAIASENLIKPDIAARLKELMLERTESLEITTEYVLKTIVDTIERCKQAKPVKRSNGELVYVETDDGRMVPSFTFDANAVLKGAELLGRYRKMFSDKVELTGKDGAPIEQNLTVSFISTK